MSIFENSSTIKFNNKEVNAIYVDGKLVQGDEIDCPFPDGWPAIPDRVYEVESYRKDNSGNNRTDTQTIQAACEALNKTGGTLIFPENGHYFIQPKVDPNYITQMR